MLVRWNMYSRQETRMNKGYPSSLGILAVNSYCASGFRGKSNSCSNFNPQISGLARGWKGSLCRDLWLRDTLCNKSDFDPCWLSWSSRIRADMLTVLDLPNSYSPEGGCIFHVHWPVSLVSPDIHHSENFQLLFVSRLTNVLSDHSRFRPPYRFAWVVDKCGLPAYNEREGYIVRIVHQCLCIVTVFRVVISLVLHNLS